MGKRVIICLEDVQLRSEVADTILIGLSQDALFGESEVFAKWCALHKHLLIRLFGGQGIVNLQRVVSWARREAYELRRDPPEILSLIADATKDGSIPSELAEAFMLAGMTNIPDVLRRCLTDIKFSKSMLAIAPHGGLAALIA